MCIRDSPYTILYCSTLLYRTKHLLLLLEKVVEIDESEHLAHPFGRQLTSLFTRERLIGRLLSFVLLLVRSLGRSVFRKLQVRSLVARWLTRWQIRRLTV